MTIMNRKIIIVAILSLLIPVSASADWGSFFRNLGKAAAGAIGGAILEQSCVLMITKISLRLIMLINICISK